MDTPTKTPPTFLNIRILISVFFSVIIVLITAQIAVTTISTQKNLVKEKEELLLWLSKNTTQQIVSNFLSPAIEAFGRISLAIPEQYTQLHTTMLSSIQGFSITSSRIYAPNGAVVYSFGTLTNPDAMLSIRRSATIQKPLFTTNIPSALAIFLGMYEAPTIYSYYPMVVSIEPIFQFERTTINSEFWGILEIGMDITSHINQIRTTYRTLALFTSVLIGTALLLITTIVYKTNAIVSNKVLALEQIKQELAHNERLASMGRTVAAIAHEIRNPLGIIYSSTDLLLRQKATLSERSIRILQAISQETQRLRTLVNTFLDYAKPSTISNVPVDVASVVHSVISFIETKREECKCTITVAIPEHYVLLSEKNLLYRAIFNIVDNALDAPHVNTISICCIATAEHFSIIIEDNGIGFSGEIPTYVEPFYTTKDTGTGLGLAITQTILESHNGTLILSNTQEGGARVTMQFPITRLQHVEDI